MSKISPRGYDHDNDDEGQIRYTGDLKDFSSVRLPIHVITITYP
jgi:hypothetical protein